MPLLYKTPQAKRGGSDVGEGLCGYCLWAAGSAGAARCARRPSVNAAGRRGASRGGGGRGASRTRRRGGRGASRTVAGWASLRTGDLRSTSGRFPGSLRLADSAPLRFAPSARRYAPPTPLPVLGPVSPAPRRSARPRCPPPPHAPPPAAPPQQNGGASSAASRPGLPRCLYICISVFTFVIFVVPFCPCLFIFVIFVVSICNAASLQK